MAQQYKPKNYSSSVTTETLQDSQKINCVIFNVEGAGPDAFFKKSVWQIGIKQGTFMSIGKMRHSLAARLQKQPAQVRLFVFSGTGASSAVFGDKQVWVESPSNGKITRGELIPSNLIYATNDEDKIEVNEQTRELMAGHLVVTAVLVVSSQADDFGLIPEEPKRDLKGELLAMADSLSFNLDQIRQVALGAQKADQ